jgi:hypothetical protein
MSLCCRRHTSNVSDIIDACIKRDVGFPDIEHFEALGLRHMEEVSTYCFCFFIVISCTYDRLFLMTKTFFKCEMGLVYANFVSVSNSTAKKCSSFRYLKKLIPYINNQELKLSLFSNRNSSSCTCARYMLENIPYINDQELKLSLFPNRTCSQCFCID